jgi:tetratricopeptide (TPR) repeat protein
MPRVRALPGRLAGLSVLLALSVAPALAIGQDEAAGDEASQDPDARARELYENGAMLYEEGRYDEAVVAFQAAYHLSKRPALLYNIANAQERAGKWAEAMESLNLYRAYAPADEREVLDRRIRNIERRLDETKAKARQEARPEPPPEEEGPAAPRTSADPGSPTLLRPLPLGLAGVGVVAFGTAIALGVTSEAAREEAELACRETKGGTYCSSGAALPLQTHIDTALAADIATLVGVLGVGSGVTLALVGPGGPLQAVGTASVVIGPMGIAIAGEF